MACRSLDRGESAREEVISSLKSQIDDIESRVILLPLDLSDLSSVREFSSKFDELHLPCHYLIQNAGVMNIPQYTTTANGVEMQWGTNHLGHFYMARLMLPKLQEDPPSRLVCVSS